MFNQQSKNNNKNKEENVGYKQLSSVLFPFFCASNK